MRSAAAFSWTKKDGMIDLGVGDTDGCAYAVSPSGLAVGVSRSESGEWHATVWVPNR